MDLRHRISKLETYSMEVCNFYWVVSNHSFAVYSYSCNKNFMLLCVSLLDRSWNLIRLSLGLIRIWLGFSEIIAKKEMSTRRGGSGNSLYPIQLRNDATSKP